MKVSILNTQVFFIQLNTETLDGWDSLASNGLMWRAFDTNRLEFEREGVFRPNPVKILNEYFMVNETRKNQFIPKSKQLRVKTMS